MDTRLLKIPRIFCRMGISAIDPSGYWGCGGTQQFVGVGKIKGGCEDMMIYVSSSQIAKSY